MLIKTLNFILNGNRKFMEEEHSEFKKYRSF